MNNNNNAVRERSLPHRFFDFIHNCIVSWEPFTAHMTNHLDVRIDAISIYSMIAAFIYWLCFK